MQHMDNHSHPNGAAVSQNADGVWHNLKPAPGLWAADVAVPEGQSACVVVQPIMAKPVFFLSPFRAWELLLGSLLALVEVPLAD